MNKKNIIVVLSAMLISALAAFAVMFFVFQMPVKESLNAEKAEVKRLHAEIEKKDDELEDLHSTLNEKDLSLKNINDSLDKKDIALSEKEADLIAEKEKVSAIQSEVEKAEKELKNKASLLSTAKKQVNKAKEISDEMKIYKKYFQQALGYYDDMWLAIENEDTALYAKVEPKYYAALERAEASDKKIQKLIKEFDNLGK